MGIPVDDELFETAVFSGMENFKGRIVPHYVQERSGKEPEHHVAERALLMMAEFEERLSYHAIAKNKEDFIRISDRLDQLGTIVRLKRLKLPEAVVLLQDVSDRDQRLFDIVGYGGIVREFHPQPFSGQIGNAVCRFADRLLNSSGECPEKCHRFLQ
jgi:hypothetical protein